MRSTQGEVTPSIPERIHQLHPRVLVVDQVSRCHGQFVLSSSGRDQAVLDRHRLSLPL